MQTGRKRPVIMQRLHCFNSQSELVGHTDRENTRPGLVDHWAVFHFVAQTLVTASTVYVPVTQEVVARGQLQVRIPTIICAVALQTTTTGFILRNAIVVVVVVLTVVLHTNTWRQG